MDIKTGVEIALYVVLGVASLYFKQKDKLNTKASELVTRAENEAKDVIDENGGKHQYIVNTLYNLVPGPFKSIFTTSFIDGIVDAAFDKAEAYARTQADKIVDKAIKDGTVTK